MVHEYEVQVKPLCHPREYCVVVWDWLFLDLRGISNAGTDLCEGLPEKLSYCSCSHDYIHSILTTTHSILFLCQAWKRYVLHRDNIDWLMILFILLLLTFPLDSVVTMHEEIRCCSPLGMIMIVFFIWDTNPGSVFMILPNNGVITVNGSLDRETKDSYNLRIGVSNFER